MVTGRGQETRTEKPDVPGEGLPAVAFRVNRDEGHLRRPLRGETAFDVAQGPERDRADIRAMSETDEDKIPAPTPVGERQRTAVGSFQGKLGQRAWLRVEPNDGQAFDGARRWRRAPTAGEEKAERGRYGGEENEAGDPPRHASDYSSAPMSESFDPAEADELQTIADIVRWAASAFEGAGLVFGHGYDNALDEAAHLVLTALGLPSELPPAYAQARLTRRERKQVAELVARRIRERIPTAYLIGEAWFCGLAFSVDRSVLVPRSPIAELIKDGFQPWLGALEVHRALDLCCGSGCIGIAMAVNFPDWQVDLADVSAEALALARRNAEQHGVLERVRLLKGDLFDAEGLAERYELIVCNPPYVPSAAIATLPPEYAHEPRLGLDGGPDGLDVAARVLSAAPDRLAHGGLLVLELGDSAATLAEALPEIPFTWVEFSTGDMGVLVARQEELLEWRPAVQRWAAARQREGVR